MCYCPYPFVRYSGSYIVNSENCVNMALVPNRRGSKGGWMDRQLVRDVICKGYLGCTGPGARDVRGTLGVQVLEQGM